MRHFQPSTFPPPLVSQDILQWEPCLSRWPGSEWLTEGWRNLRQKHIIAPYPAQSGNPNQPQVCWYLLSTVVFPIWRGQLGTCCCPGTLRFSSSHPVLSYTASSPAQEKDLDQKKSWIIFLTVWKIQSCTKIIVLLVGINHSSSQVWLSMSKSCHLLYTLWFLSAMINTHNFFFIGKRPHREETQLKDFSCLTSWSGNNSQPLFPMHILHHL